MSRSEDDALKSVAESLVRALAHPGSSQLLRMLGPGSETQAEAPLVRSEAGWVGIWRQSGADGSFRRSAEHTGQWHLWADVVAIPPKTSRKRLVYIGESAARGYFYDPAYTPACVLQPLLDIAGVPDGVEVIDLARSDLAFEGDLVRLLESARALAPDAYVIFAGNNRKLPRSVLKSPPSRTSMLAEVLRSAGIPGLCGLTAGWRRQEVEKILATLAGLLAPVLVIVPEFNLGDWTPETSGDVPWLPGDGNRRWFERLDRARDALRSGDLAAAERQALEMIRLDGGTASSGLAIMSECMRHRGDQAGIRDYAGRARDAHMGWDFGSPETPRLDGVTKSALVQGLDAAGIPYLDCAHEFAEHLGGETPDRRLFLDYCHLTSEGIRLTMARAAQRLSPLLGGAPLALPALLRAAPSPPPEVEAQARFAAAIHNAHWGQPFGIVHHHCAQAVALAPHFSPLFEEYMAMAACRAPNWMCRQMEPLLAAPCPALVKYVLGYGAVSQLDLTLTDAIAAAIEPHRPGAGTRLRELRLREYGLAPGEPEDLLAAEYAPSFMDREWAHSGLGGAVESRQRPVVHFVAHAPSSRFVFVCDGGRPIRIEMTCRLVHAASPGAVRLSVNGEALSTAAVSHDWGVVHAEVPVSFLVGGPNRLEVRWEPSLIPGEDALAGIAEKTAQRLGSAHLTPVYAMVHALTARIDSDKRHD